MNWGIVVHVVSAILESWKSKMYEVVLNCDGIEENDESELRFKVFHYCNRLFDFNFPFRPLIEFIAECLRGKGIKVELTLPQYIELEDFVTGSLIIEGREIAVYFEHSLSYVSFASNSQEDLMMLVNASQGKVFQHMGYGLDNAQFG
jgi:hypothetical protein